MTFYKDPIKLRTACRNGGYAGPTSGHAHGYVQANMVILPKEDADDFHLFCEQNPIFLLGIRDFFLNLGLDI